MASSSQNTSAKYDVFISFRGEDVRLGFLSHLKTKLKRKDIDAFVDDRLEIGDKISSALFRAIEISKNSLVIFSENYAESTWCLDELVKIVDCMNTRKHVVIPVFYNIDPSVVRHQIGPYKDAFDQHEKRHNKEKVQLWRSALLDAANLSGFHYSKFSPLSPKDEAELVKKIAEILVRKLKCDSSTNFNVNEYDNGIREFMSMEIADNNNNANQNKNKKEKMYLSSSHLVGGNMVANGGPQPQYYGYSIDGNPYQATTTTPATTMNATHVGIQSQYLGPGQMPQQMHVVGVHNGNLIRFQERQQHHFNRWLNLQNEKQFGGEGYGKKSSYGKYDEYDDGDGYYSGGYGRKSSNDDGEGNYDRGYGRKSSNDDGEGNYDGGYGRKSSYGKYDENDDGEGFYGERYGWSYGKYDENDDGEGNYDGGYGRKSAYRRKLYTFSQSHILQHPQLQ